MVTAMVAVLVATPVLAQGREPYKKSAGPHEVATAFHDWVDVTRNREVPVKIYYPKEEKGPWPVIIFSHGLGGSREGYAYLGNHWASHGYVSVHLTHKGSDTEVLLTNPNDVMGAMKAAASDPKNAVNRAMDVRFAVDEVTKLADGDSPVAGRLDLEHIGMAGHSFGAWTTLAVVGQGAAALERTRFRFVEPRIKAAIAMSAPVAETMKRQPHAAFGWIQTPCFHMTGTLDTSPTGDTAAEDRRIPYDHITRADQYLVTFEGGDHMVFAGAKRLRGGGEKDAVFQDLIRQGSTAFWDAYLKDDEKAKKWLAEGGFGAALGRDGRFERKRAAR
jgi:predicted dienelactone hydrolase